MLSEKEAKRRIQKALDFAKDYIKNEQNFSFDRIKVEEALRKRSDYLGLKQEIYWLEGLSDFSLSSLRSSLRSSLESSLRSSLESSLRSSLRSSLESSLRSSLWSSLESFLRSSLRSSLWSSLRSSLESSLESSLWSSLESSFYFKWWDAEYIAANNTELREYSKFMGEAIASGLGFVCDFEKAIIAIPMPKFWKDTERRLHRENGPAVIWKDGHEQYYLSGVEFDKELYRKVVEKKIKAIDLLKLENIEQRFAALKTLGADRLLKELNARLINKSPKNSLYKIEGIISKPIKLLKYICPSTGRLYTKFVPFEMEKADEAQSWSFGLKLEEYYSLKAET